VLVSAFALVLLVACANVMNMMLARGLSRQRELGVRLSLGATRARVVRQLVIESLVLALPAAAIGLALTLMTARVFPRGCLSQRVLAGASDP
jgi:ABC-type antimicrobial peptide transport system permease subunit